MEPIELFKALSDETRLRILLRLIEKPHCVCELTDILNLSQPKISKHLSKLRDLNLVETDRDAQFIIYKIHTKQTELSDLIRYISSLYKNHPLIHQDAFKQSSCTIETRLRKDKPND